MERLGFMREGQFDLPAGPHWLYRKDLAEERRRDHSSRPPPDRFMCSLCPLSL